MSSSRGCARLGALDLAMRKPCHPTHAGVISHVNRRGLGKDTARCGVDLRAVRILDGLEESGRSVAALPVMPFVREHAAGAHLVCIPPRPPKRREHVLRRAAAPHRATSAAVPCNQADARSSPFAGGSGRISGPRQLTLPA